MEHTRNRRKTIEEISRVLKLDGITIIGTPVTDTWEGRIWGRYLDKDLKLTDWLTELLDYALYNNIVTREEFPSYLLFLYDSWVFYSREEYQRLYEQTIIYENGDPLTREIFSSHYTSSAIIQRLRTEGKLFAEKQTPVTEFLT